MKHSSQRLGFKSNIGAIAALAGSAIGLGNIWKFPYMVGVNGGGAFLIVYILFILGIGLPLMLSESILGRNTQQNIVGTYKKLAPGTNWKLFGLLSTIGVSLILAFYGTISAWTLEYLQLALTNSLEGKSTSELDELYNNLISHPYKAVLWHIGFMIMTGFIILGGIQKGIEKASKIMMPLLLVIIIVLCINALTLPGSEKGLKFLFYPKLSDLTHKSVLAALGQSFFSLSVGMGSILTYASYISKKDNLLHTSLKVITADTLVAILAGVAILPAVFSFNINPEAGPGLAFLTLPKVFQNLPAGEIWAILFFVLLTFAALTSAISLLEVPVSYLVEEKKIKRTPATLVATCVITIIGAFCTLSFGPLRGVQLFGLNLFEMLDYVCSNILLPVGGILLSIFTGWYLNKSILYRELSNEGTLKIRFFKGYIFILRYIAPACIGMVLLHSTGIL